MEGEGNGLEKKNCGPFRGLGGRFANRRPFRESAPFRYLVLPGGIPLFHEVSGVEISFFSATQSSIEVLNNQIRKHTAAKIVTDKG